MTAKALRETLEIDDDAYIYVSVPDDVDGRQIYAIIEPMEYTVCDQK